MLSPSVEQAQHLDAQARRQVELHRAFKKMLPIRLTNAQKLVLSRAVRLTLRAEMALSDATVTANDLVRLDNAARRARAEWGRLASTHKPKEPPLPLLSELLEGVR
jgi:hypothetical protein